MSSKLERGFYSLITIPLSIQAFILLIRGHSLSLYQLKIIHSQLVLVTNAPNYTSKIHANLTERLTHKSPDLRELTPRGSLPPQIEILSISPTFPFVDVGFPTETLVLRKVSTHIQLGFQKIALCFDIRYGTTHRSISTEMFPLL